MVKLKKLFDILTELVHRRFTGRITIHFSQGTPVEREVYDREKI